MHGYAHPAHEMQAAEIARSMGFTQVSVSHEVSPLIRLVPRGDTTVADAYLSPILREYVDRVATALDLARSPRLLFMASSGGLKSAQHFHGRDAILSGPAGGVVGMAETARAAGFERVIGFDMGGTSTDVSHFAGTYERSFETQVAGVRLRVPMLSIHTVAAGGGSILKFDGTHFTAGPESAGADPGPMCYRRGGPLTITDANVMVGKLRPSYFPSVFGPQGNEPIDERGCWRSLRASSRATWAMGAHQRMLLTASSVSPSRTWRRRSRGSRSSAATTSTRYALNCFGAAGGQHACLIADTLGMETVLVHPLSGLLSAYGIGLSGLRASREQSLEVPLDDRSMHDIENTAWLLGNAVTEELLDQDVEHDDIALTTWLHVRYEGTDTALPVQLSEPDMMRRDFEAEHRSRFGFISPEKRLFVAHIEVEAVGGGAECQAFAAQHGGVSTPLERVRIYSGGSWHDASVYRREAIAVEDRITGPALIIEPHQTVVVEAGLVGGNYAARRSHPEADLASRAPDCERARGSRAARSVQQPLHGAGRADGRSAAQHGAIGEHQGAARFLVRPVRRQGQLVANAPHVPVHLGSMDSVRRDRDPRARGVHAPRRRVHAQRAL